VKPASGEHLDPTTQQRIRGQLRAQQDAANPTLGGAAAHPSRTPTTRCSIRVRVPGAEAALRPLHPGDGRTGLRRPRDLFAQVCELVHGQSGRDRTTAFVYSLGWTQHTVGVQYIRTAAILQALLGNMGRPGGGILALRGHASIQGPRTSPPVRPATRLPAHAVRGRQRGPRRLCCSRVRAARILGDTREYLVSLLKAWWGEAAMPENDFCYDYLPRLTGSHSTYETVLAQLDGTCKGYFCSANPAVGSANARMQRLAWRSWTGGGPGTWLMIESATWWKDGPEIESGEMRPEEIGTEVFFLPAAAPHREGRQLHQHPAAASWHHQAVEPAGDVRSDLWFTTTSDAGSGRSWPPPPRRRTGRCSTSPGTNPTTGALGDPDADAVLAESTGGARAGSRCSS